MVQYLFYILLLSGLLFPGCSDHKGKNSQLGTGETVTFAVYGNTGTVTDDGAIFRKLIDYVNSSQSEFVVDLGNYFPPDIPSSGADAIWDALDKERAQVTKSVYPVAGPHDIFDSESEEMYTDHCGPSWYSFTNKGSLFIVLCTEDGSYKKRFGMKGIVSEEQLAWLDQCLKSAPLIGASIVFMGRPLWNDNETLWRERLVPLLKRGGVDLVISCWEKGFYNWGMIDGLQAISTGCTGPVKSPSGGCFPHVLFVTVNGEKTSFKVLTPDGKMTDTNGFTNPVSKIFDAEEDIAQTLTPPVLNVDPSWNIHESLMFSLTNKCSIPLTGKVVFSIFKNTSWKIVPSLLEYLVEPGEQKTLHVEVQGIPPELGPLPEYYAEVSFGGMTTGIYDQPLNLKIPNPREGDLFPISAQIADVIPYPFTGRTLKIPVDIDRYDLCGRLVIYREGRTELPVCVHISQFIDFRPGLNEFTWNGSDLEGKKVEADSLVYRVFIYNRKAPVTWVATGPPDYKGTTLVERTLSGLVATTHDNDTILSYRIGVSKNVSKPEPVLSVKEMCDGLPLLGFCYGENDHIYMATEAGIACFLVDHGKANPVHTFGDKGYVRFTKYRGRKIGSPSYAKGYVLVSIGGSLGISPELIKLDGESGEVVSEMNLGEFFGEESEPPVVSTTERGIYCAHPYCDYIIHMSPQDEIIWVADSTDGIIGKNTDGKSFIYGIGVDSQGFSYVNSPGATTRCGIIGPDGRGLFRVILVQLPALRVSSVIPILEGKSTDGLYLVTRGGDIPYIFHVPFTVRTGLIVATRHSGN
jgi:hypothetical protein